MKKLIKFPNLDDLEGLFQPELFYGSNCQTLVDHQSNAIAGL